MTTVLERLEGKKEEEEAKRYTSSQVSLSFTFSSVGRSRTACTTARRGQVGSVPCPVPVNVLSSRLVDARGSGSLTPLSRGSAHRQWACPGRALCARNKAKKRGGTSLNFARSLVRSRTARPRCVKHRTRLKEPTLVARSYLLDSP